MHTAKAAIAPIVLSMTSNYSLTNKGDKMIDIEVDYATLRNEVSAQLIEQDGKYNSEDRDTNVRIVEDIRKAIGELADGIIPSAAHIAEVAIATNEYLQIRDFIMGVQTELNIDYVAEYVSLLGNVIVKDKAVPLATIFCGYLYQTGEIEKANVMLLDVLSLKPDYALAGLLARVFAAEWEPSDFGKMATQLHPGVLNTIYAIDVKEIGNDN